MALSLSDLIQQIYIEMGLLRISEIESGSKNTIVDSGLSENGVDDNWIDGTAIILSADEAAPEGEFSRIIGFDHIFGTLTLENDLTVEVEAGDSFGLAVSLLPIKTLIELVNFAIRSLGEIPLIEEISFQEDDEVSWDKRPPILIDLKRSSFQNWQRLFNWEYVPNWPSADGKITFQSSIHSGSLLRVWYVDKHPSLKVFDDKVSEVIANELAVAVCMERATRWVIMKLGGGDKFQQRMWEDAKSALETAKKN